MLLKIVFENYTLFHVTTSVTASPAAQGRGRLSLRVNMDRQKHYFHTVELLKNHQPHRRGTVVPVCPSLEMPVP